MNCLTNIRTFTHLPVHGKEESSLSISIFPLAEGRGMKGAEIILSLPSSPPPPPRRIDPSRKSLSSALPPPDTEPSAVNLGAALGREGLMKPSSLRPPGSDSSYLQSKELGKEVIRL